jgi:hypothetical protein
MLGTVPEMTPLLFIPGSFQLIIHNLFYCSTVYELIAIKQKRKNCAVNFEVRKYISLPRMLKTVKHEQFYLFGKQYAMKEYGDIDV